MPQFMELKLIKQVEYFHEGFPQVILQDFALNYLL